MRRAPVLLLLLTLASPAALAASTVEVGAVNGAFDPERIEVAPGDTVVFVNRDDRAHTVTSSWDGGATFHKVIKPGESFSWTFEEAGEWGVHCVPHAMEGEGGAYEGMAMTVSVAEPAPASSSPLSTVATATMGILALALLAGGAVAWNARRTRRAA